MGRLGFDAISEWGDLRVFESVGYLLRLPWFLIGALGNAFFSMIEFVVVNIISLAVTLGMRIYFYATYWVVFLLLAFQGDKRGWEEYRDATFEFSPYLTGFTARQNSLVAWLQGGSRLSNEPDVFGVGCVTWFVGLPLILLVLFEVFFD